MPRKCTICSDRRRRKVDAAIRSGKSLRYIALQILGDERRFMSVNRHTTICLKLDIGTLQVQVKHDQAIDYHAELNAQMNFARRARIAAEKWLTDPNNPEQFTLAPRGDEIEVVYRAFSDHGGYKTQTDTLQELLDQAAGMAPVQTKIIMKTVDMREYALKTLASCDLVLDKFAKVQGLYQMDAANQKDKTSQAAAAIRQLIAEKPDLTKQQINELIDTIAKTARIPREDIAARVSEMVH